MMTETTAQGAQDRGRITAAVLTDDPDISRFEAEWERLFAFPGNEPSTSFEWTQAMLRHHLAPADRFFLIAIVRDSETVALLPLVLRSMRVFGCPVRVLCPLSDSYNTHSDVLARSLDGDAVRVLLAGLHDLPLRWDTFRMSNILESHEFVRHFADAIRHRPLAGLVRDAHASYFLGLPASFDEYLAARSSKFRNYLKRVERRIVAEGEASVTDYTAADEVDRAYDMLLEIERASWKHEHGTAISAVPHQVGFYRDLCRGAAERGRLHLQVLSFGGRPAAYNLGYVRDSTYSYLKTSYGEAWRQLGVATWLRAQLIRSLIDRGLRFMDFPAEPYEWERQWTESVRWHRKLALFSATPVGVCLSLAERLRRDEASERFVSHIDPRSHAPRQ
jgi:CelD/BcsL family acetyltransferase involved in cellulose biosynthesis